MNFRHCLNNVETVASERDSQPVVQRKTLTDSAKESVDFKQTILADMTPFQDQDVNLDSKHEGNSEKEHIPLSISEEIVQRISASPILCDCGRLASEKVVGDKNINKGLRYLSCANFVPFYMKKRSKDKLLKDNGASCHFFRWLDPPRISYEEKKQAKAEKCIAKERDFKRKRQQESFATRAVVRNEKDSLQAQEVEASPAFCSRFALKKTSEAEVLQDNVQDTRGHAQGKKNLRNTEVTETIGTKTIGYGSASLDTTAGKIKRKGHGIHAQQTDSAAYTKESHLYPVSYGNSTISTLQGKARTDNQVERECAGFPYTTATKDCRTYVPEESKIFSYVSPCTEMMNAQDAYMCKPQDVQCKHSGSIDQSDVKIVSSGKIDGCTAVKASLDATEAALCDCKKEAVLKSVKKKTVNHGRLYWVCADAVNPFQKNKSKAAKEACKFFKWLDPPKISDEEKKQAKAEKHIAKERDFKRKRHQEAFATEAVVRNEKDSLQAQDVEASPTFCSRFALKQRSEAEVLQDNVQDIQGHTKGKKNSRTTDVTETIGAKIIGYGSASLDTTAGKIKHKGHGIHAQKIDSAAYAKEIHLCIYPVSYGNSSISTFQGKAGTDNQIERECAGFPYTTATKDCSTHVPEENENSSYASPCTNKMNAREAYMCKPQDVQCKHSGSSDQSDVKIVSLGKTDGCSAVKASLDAAEAALCDCKKEAVLKSVKKKTVNHGRLYWVCADAVNPFQKNKSKAAKEACKFFKWLDDSTVDEEDHEVKKPRSELNMLS